MGDIYTMPGSGDNFQPNKTENYSMPDEEYEKPSEHLSAIQKNSKQEEKYSDNYTDNYSSVKHQTADEFKI